MLNPTWFEINDLVARPGVVQSPASSERPALKVGDGKTNLAPR